MADPLPRDIGDMQQTVHTTQIDERAVIGDVLDHTLKDLAFLEVRDKFGAGFGTALFQNGPARYDNVAATTVDFQDLEWLWCSHQRAKIAHRADIDLAARQKGGGA
ncbi:MAG: Uncharacterised protein [SAR116 cluster bacterium]|nr:MAG: Uncharacterised protein [SAR116 cluster bacterium]